MTNARIRTLYTLSMLALDALMALLAFVVAYILRLQIPFPSPPANIGAIWTYIPMLLVQILSILFVFYANKLYHVARAVSRFDEFYAIFGAVSIGIMLTIAVSTLTFKNSIFELDFPRGMILYAWLLSIFLIQLGREIHRRVWHRLRMRGYGRDRVLVMGGGDSALAIVQKIQWSPYLGYELLGLITEDGQPHDIPGVPIVGKYDEVNDLLDRLKADEIIIALPEGAPRSETIRLVNQLQRDSVSIKIFPDLFEYVTTGVTIGDLGGLPLLNVRDIQLRGWKRSLKRALDVAGSGLGLVMLSPLLMLFAFLIRLESPGPVFYCQERMGLDGKPFQIIKFRSMRQDAERDGPGWTQHDDPRRTILGRWLRQHDVDELPQLINVLLGDMSLVGPRPERPVYVEQFKRSIPRYMDRHREKAGITGWAQVNGLRGDTSIPERTKYDVWYVENWSIWLDIRILVRTVVGVFFNRTQRNAP